MIDAIAGRTLNSKIPKMAHDLIEEMAMNSYQWQAICSRPSRPASVYNIDTEFVFQAGPAPYLQVSFVPLTVVASPY